MRIDILTLFPAMFEGPFGHSILKIARERGALDIRWINPRDFTQDSHRTVDDKPYGGGKGMLLKAEPLFRALKSVRRKGSFVAYLSPKGRRLDQALLRRLSRKRHLILVCGHYEGVDQRFLQEVDMEISIGDYILTGGEIPAMVVVDAVGRLIPGVLEPQAVCRESFEEGRLEYPQYTRPRVWRGKRVPRILLSGDHQGICRWRNTQSLRWTRCLRPDMLSSLPTLPLAGRAAHSLRRT